VGWATKEIDLTFMPAQTSIPQTFVITPDGRLLRRFIGYSPKSMDSLREAIEEALRPVIMSPMDR
jgi:hypothetical protein